MYRSLALFGLFSLLAVACTSQATPQSEETSQADGIPEEAADAPGDLPLDPELLPTIGMPVPEATAVPEPKRYTSVMVGGDLHRLGWATDTGSFVIVTGVFPKDEPADVVVIDVPRDLYVPISCQNGAVDRIVAAYAIGLDAGDGERSSGIDCVRQVVEDQFGLEVNSGVALATGDAFENLVDSFGGLKITPKTDHERRCGKDGAFRWTAGLTYQMDGKTVKCYLKLRNNGSGRDEGRSARAGQVVTAMAVQWLPLYVEHPIESVLNSWHFWNENVHLSLRLGEALRLAPLIPRAQDADIRSARFRLGEDFSEWTSPQGIPGLKPQVGLKEWTACMISGKTDQQLEQCLATLSSLP